MLRPYRGTQYILTDSLQKIGIRLNAFQYPDQKWVEGLRLNPFYLAQSMLNKRFSLLFHS
jgi:hypothetical protein